MQDNIPEDLIAAFERQYDVSFDHPDFRNERLAMRYGWQAAMDHKSCLHQIQEPASVSNATSQAAPAAVAVPDGWKLVPVDLTPEMKREFMDLLMDGIDIYVNRRDQIEIQTDAPRRIWKAVFAISPAAPQAQADARDAVLAHLDGLLDDAAAHIYPSDLNKFQTGEHTATVASVRMGNSSERSVPLYSREQVAEAFDAAQAAQQGGAA